MRGTKHYRTIEEFTREEIRSHMKLGWSLDDLYDEANIHKRRGEFEDGESETAELNFDY